jgi:threonine dehydratase
MCPTLTEVRISRDRLAGLVVETPIVESVELNDDLNCTAFWKLENFQHSNAFKVRGALNRCLSLKSYEQSRGIVAPSSGNHGIGVSFAAREANVRATIVMPVNSPRTKQEKVRRYGASVLLRGNNYDEALAWAEQHASDNHLTLVSSFDDPEVIAGQGTLALEILQDLDDIDDVVVPIGGGGLAAGVGIVLKSLKPSVRIYGVQSKAAPSCYDSYLAGTHVTAFPSTTIADGLVCVRPGRLTFPIIQQVIHEILLIDESSIAGAVKALYSVLKIVVEPAGAASFAAVATHREIFSRRRVACVVTGGNIDPDVLSGILNTPLV